MSPLEESVEETVEEIFADGDTLVLVTIVALHASGQVTVAPVYDLSYDVTNGEIAGTLRFAANLVEPPC